ncbi:peptidase S41 [Aquimarina sp. MMG015]|uniref:S41 family peptidase n=1 Tax=Aquimarina sp. MMG015 TaxID=2822689 RepID=UPI001B3A5BAF|nr:S41 family peptidase [Aquimarina sp. MMG015]MBQ4805265.1 peptidase S41 [Aquimarina sp. MMG015]
MKLLKYFTALLFLGSIVTGCFDDNDDVIQPSSDLDIKDFIRRGMNVWYLYKEDVPDLADDRFSSNGEYTDFLNSFNSPESFFDHLVADQDEFSWIVSDYIALEQLLDGITLNNGMEFGLVRYPNEPTQVFGYVRYVLPETDAEAKGIKRGDIFNTIDGTQITDSNTTTLLSPESYTIGLATFDGTNITPTGESVSLTKTQYTENPVFLAKTLNVGGNPVGYLMYNGFRSNFEAELNNAFGQFKSDGVTDFILDLRYNGGGDTETTKDLASMITGQFNGEVFTTEEWNSDRQPQFGDTNRFDNQIRNGDGINSLNLSRVYILTTNRSASASELIINGLDPYITVTQIGDVTRGKFQASTTIYDSDNYFRSGTNLNLGHTYAMQPLILKTINSVGFTDYFNGFTPEISNPEDYSNLGVLGDPDEPLLNAAINAILGNRSNIQNKNIEFSELGDSNMHQPDYERMYKTFDK